jgi:hypothetical protein
MIRYKKDDFSQKVGMNQATSRPTLDHSNLELNIDSKLVKITKRIYLETKCLIFPYRTLKTGYRFSSQ